MRLVPDELWVLVEPLVREFRARRQGGGTAPLPARAVFTAIEYVLTSGCSWRDLPPSFGVRTGPASSLMRHRCVRKGGIADRAEPGRPRQARFEDPRHVRTRWGAACRWCLGREHQRLLRAQALGEGDPRDPIPPSPTSPRAWQAPRGQGLRHQREARPPPLGRAVSRRRSATDINVSQYATCVAVRTPPAGLNFV
jgi:transposase